MEVLAWTTSFLRATAAGLATLLALSLLVPFTLAAITWWRQRLRKNVWSCTSAVHVGRVWHIRFLPIRHAFSYPFFIFCVNLREAEENALFDDYLWPLSCIMNFRADDHLKNGEGQLHAGATADAAATVVHDLPLRRRVQRLVAERTHNKITPTHETHDIFLITHLCYYGYCFNPVSFYYVVERHVETLVTSYTTTAVVAEVSNTPWLEMHCYVLHPDSVDMQAVKRSPGGPGSGGGAWHAQFAKRFHVSPFMEMDYMYDWSMGDLPMVDGGGDANNQHYLHVRNSMQRHSNTHFTATMKTRAHPLNVFRLGWQMARFPAYCVIVQVWIHYQAFWLFAKGVTFQPHPDGTETLASRVVGKAMEPFFAVQAWCNRQSWQWTDQKGKNA